MYLRKKLEREVKDEDSGVCSTDGTCPAVQVIGYKRRPSTGFKGLQVGFVEQRVAAAASHFIAAAESQFSKAIHSRRVKLKQHKSWDQMIAKGAKLKPICDDENPSEPAGCGFL